MRKLEEVEPFDLTVVTSAMLEKEELWKRVTESAVLGEGSASGEDGGSVLLYIFRIVVLVNVCVKNILRICVVL